MYSSSLMEGGDNGFILALYMKMNMQSLCIKIESIVSYRSAASDCFLDRFTFFILICKNSENTDACQIPKASFVQRRIFKATLKPVEETETILQLCKAETVEYFHMNNSWRLSRLFTNGEVGS